MVFDEKSLEKYLTKGKVPKSAMIWLNQLLHSEILKYCDVCEEDRMLCVLNPQCEERILLKVRMQADAKLEDLPKFCYNQSVNNLKRFIEKRTTLYNPIDCWVYNKDFLDIMFPRLYSKIIKNYQTNLKKVHSEISNSKVPAINLDLQNAESSIFRKIVERDKLIREGTFIYDISGDYLVIWFEGNIFISNFLTDITICNAVNDPIEELKLMELVFHAYCAELNVKGRTKVDGKNQIKFTMTISFDQINQIRFENESEFFQNFIEFMQKYFFKIQMATDSKKNLNLSMFYNKLENFLDRNKLSVISYDILHLIVKKFNELRIGDQE
jgi:hypothetical protein